MTTLAEIAATIDDIEGRNLTDPEEAAEAISTLFTLEHRIRGIAWNSTVRATVQGTVLRIREVMHRIEQEHDLVPTPHWTLEQVIAGGPGYERRWPGYSR